MGRKLKGSIQKKGESWYFRILLRSKKRYIARIPNRPSGKAIDEKHARNFAAQKVKEYLSGEWDPEAPLPGGDFAKAQTVKEYGEAWLARLSNANLDADVRLFKRHIVPVLGHMRIEEVKRVHAREFVDALKQKKSKRGGTLSARSVRNIYSVLQRLFAHVEDSERIPLTPCRLQRKSLPVIVDKDPKARRGWIRTKTEVAVFITDKRIPVDRRMLYALLFLTGARFSEVAVLRWPDWDRNATPLGRLYISRSRDHRTGGEKTTKTGVPREVPVHRSLAPILEAWWSAGWEDHYGRAPRTNDFIVPSRGFTSRDVRNGWTRHQEDCDEVGIQRGRQHDARRTFISMALSDGASRGIMEWITHDKSTKSVMDLYTTLSWDSLCGAVDCIKIGPFTF